MNKELQIPIRFDAKLFIYLSIGFIIATVIGTLTHEFGHYIVAESLGHDTSISYGSIHIENYRLVPRWHKFWISLGGPAETVLTGSIGFLLMIKFRKSFYANSELNFRQWIMTFVALFWLRQLSNFVMGWIHFFESGKISTRGDESKLDRHLGLPNDTILTHSALCAAIILMIIIFGFIPKSQRLTFIISGIVGGVAGFYLWLHCLGEIILP